MDSFPLITVATTVMMAGRMQNAMLSWSSEFKPKLLYMNGYDAIRELKVSYYCLTRSSIYGYPG